MKIPTKQEYFKQLRSNKEYLSILKGIPDAAERKKAINTVEYIIGSLFEAFTMSKISSKENPEAEEKISQALKTGDGIIKESDGAPIEPKEK
jgi:hypothetical protein